MRMIVNMNAREKIKINKQGGRTVLSDLPVIDQMSTVPTAST